MAIAIFVAFYEQQNDHPNVYVIIIAIAFFMFGMLRLSAKIPTKNQDADDYNV